MLEVKRKAEESKTGTATVRVRAFPQPPSTGTTDSEGTRKGSVIAQGARHAVATSPGEPREFQAKVPVITGEAHYRGMVAVEGLLSGQLGASSGCLSVKQSSNANFGSKPQLDGELSFRDVVRVSGHIAGTVSSAKGTIIVDVGARVDAQIDVAVAVISGTVNGDIIARDHVEIGPVARIHGNIWTKSITIKDGAIFEGVCRMIEDAS